MEWSEIWNGIIVLAKDSGLTLLKAIGIWIIGYIVARIILAIVKKIFAKTNLEKITQGFLISIIRFTLYLILLVIILSTLGIEITGIVTALAAAGLAIGLALQDSLSNVASGIILLITHPFNENDYVCINGIEGYVKNIKILTTAITTLDNKLVIYPNSLVANNQIINYSIRKKRRVEFTFNLDYSSDTKLVEKVVTDVMKSNGKVHLEPAPFCSIKNFKDSGLDFFAHCWVDSEDYWEVYYYIMDNVFNEFKRNNINIPYNQVEVRMLTEEKKRDYYKEPLQERKEKIRKAEEEDILTTLLNKVETENKKLGDKIKAKNVKNKTKKANTDTQK